MRVDRESPASPGGAPCCRPKTTRSSPGSAPAPRWGTCCAGTGSRPACRPRSASPTAARPGPAAGEDLVAFRDTRGAVGLIEERCPHRGASLFYGRNEECGLRCTYHGWKFDVTGQCTDQRSEIRSFAHRIKTKSYPVRESGGIVWAYLGPSSSMTPFRDFGTDSLPSPLIGANKETIYCNWVQSMDGDLDTAHISNLHQFDAIDDIPDDGTDKPGYPSGHVDEVLAARPARAHRGRRDLARLPVRGAAVTPNGYRHARISAYIFPASTIIAQIPFSTRQIFVVPSDDLTTYRYNFTTQPPANPRGWAGRSSSPTRSTPSRCCRRTASCPAPTPARTTTGSTGSRSRGSPTAGSPTSGPRTRWRPRPPGRSTTGPRSTSARPTSP